MPDSAPVPSTNPLMIAWEAYKLTDDYGEPLGPDDDLPTGYIWHSEAWRPLPDGEDRS